MLFSFLGFFTSCTGIWLAPRWKHGWLVAAIASIPWIIYAILLPVIGWALIMQSMVLGTLDLINYWRVLHYGNTIIGGLNSLREIKSD